MKHVYKKSVQNLPGAMSAYLHQSRGANLIEEEVSKYFEIFVCEGQPKNIYRDGKLHYHDGYEYIHALRKRNFTNVILVADANSGTLLTQYYRVPHDALKEKAKNSPLKKLPQTDNGEVLFPRINFFMMGANGYSDKYVFHSAGHLTHLSAALHKGRTRILLVMHSEKYLYPDLSKKNMLMPDRSINLNVQAPARKDTFQIYSSYKGEKVRSTFFNQPMEQYFESMGGDVPPEMTLPIVYTPMEDAMRFHDIDHIITEIKNVCVRDILGDGFKDRVYLHGPKMLVDKRKAEPPVIRDTNINMEIAENAFDDFGKKLFDCLHYNTESTAGSTCAPNEEPKAPDAPVARGDQI